MANQTFGLSRETHNSIVQTLRAVSTSSTTARCSNNDTTANTRDDETNCSVCLDKPTQPVSLRCGHIFCLTCLEEAAYQMQRKCPNCRRTYRSVYVLLGDDLHKMDAYERFNAGKRGRGMERSREERGVSYSRSRSRSRSREAMSNTTRETGRNTTWETGRNTIRRTARATVPIQSQQRGDWVCIDGHWVRLDDSGESSASVQAERGWDAGRTSGGSGGWGGITDWQRERSRDRHRRRHPSRSRDRGHASSGSGGTNCGGGDCGSMDCICDAIAASGMTRQQLQAWALANGGGRGPWGPNGPLSRGGGFFGKR
jgi:Zinc finger, C3HC4 type (RING finger)